MPKLIKEKSLEIFIRGKSKWSRTIVPDPTYDKWSITLYPVSTDMPKIDDLLRKGIRNKLKKDDDGHYMTFSRPLKLKLRTGQEKPLDPPVVIDKDGNPFSEPIGDGSDVEVKLETYGGPGPGGKGTYYAARLLGVKVLKHVEYVRNEPGEEEKPASPW